MSCHVIHKTQHRELCIQSTAPSTIFYPLWHKGKFIMYIQFHKYIHWNYVCIKSFHNIITLIMSMYHAISQCYSCTYLYVIFDRSLELLKAPLLHMLYYMNWLTHDFWSRTGGWEFDRSHDAGTYSPSHWQQVEEQAPKPVGWMMCFLLMTFVPVQKFCVNIYVYIYICIFYMSSVFFGLPIVYCSLTIIV